MVEDDDELRAHATETLRELGYRILEASNGSEALQILDGDAVIDLLFTDVVMPGGMNGRQLADQAARRRPDLKMLLHHGLHAQCHHPSDTARRGRPGLSLPTCANAPCSPAWRGLPGRFARPSRTEVPAGRGPAFH